MSQFNLHSTKVLLKSKGWQLSNKAITNIYMALGGVAKYLISLNNDLTPSQAIQELCFSKDALLKDEYKTLFHSLFRDASTHYSIMNVLSRRWQGLTREEVANKTGLSRGYITIALEELVASGFISKRPFFNQKTKGMLFIATDLFSYFHHKWMAQTRIIDWTQEAFTQSYKSWSGYAFEKICHMHENQIKKALGINGIPVSSHYWSFRPQGKDEKGAQIDLLLKHENRSNNVELIE